MAMQGTPSYDAITIDQKLIPYSCGSHRIMYG
jgi:hypothetical protein